MASLNKAILVGYLGNDPELNYTQAGAAVCKLRMSTTERWFDKGERKELTTWHNIVVWGKMAETCKEYLRKGSSVFVEGRIENRSYEDKDGQKRYISEIKAEKVQFLDRKPTDNDDLSNEVQAKFPERKEPGDDDLPF